MALELIRDHFVPADSLNFSSIPAIDFHIHTNFTDGRMDIPSAVKRAEYEGLSCIAFTDHARHESTYVPEYVAAIKAIRKTTSLKIYIGLEVKIKDFEGNLDISHDDEKLLDFVSGSFHRYPARDGGYLSVTELSPTQAALIEVEASVAMIETRKPDILNHPGRVHFNNFRVPLPIEYLRRIILAAKRSDVAIEINTPTPNWKEILQECIRQRALISLGSDAHDLHEVGAAYRSVRQFFRDSNY